MEIAINIKKAAQIASELEEEEAVLKNYCSSVLSVANRCPLSGAAKTSLIQTLKNIAAGIDNERQTAGSMQKALQSSLQMYQRCEQKMLKCGDDTSVNWGNLVDPAPETGSAQTTNPTQGAFAWDWNEYVISKFGIIGDAVSAVSNIISGENEIKDWISSLKNVNSIVGGAATIVSKKGTTGAWIQSLVGTESGLKELDLSSVKNTFVSSLDKQFGSDLDLTGAKTTADQVKAGTKWMGYALTVAENFVENLDEMKTDGITAERAVSETIIESAVDIGVAALSTAAVSTIAGMIATAFPFTAPVIGSAVVIGVGAAAVTWAANGVCKWITGAVTGEQKDLGELVADTVCDIGEAAVQVKNAVEEKVTEAAKEIGSSIISGITTGWSGICSAFAQ